MRGTMRQSLLLLCLCLGFFGFPGTPDYSIYAIRLADSPGDLLSDMVVGAPKDEEIDTIYALWLIRGAGRNILFDSGFHRERWFKEWTIHGYLRPDEAVKLAGVQPEQITDIVISHAHWDHMGGIDPDDVQVLVKLNTQGRVRLVGGDNVELFPGIRVLTGGHHTYASQYLLVDGAPPFVLASDNSYLYRNLETHMASETFTTDYHAANIKNQERMIQLAGSIDRVIPGHDALQFKKFPTEGRVATLKLAK
jgi:glyoxylase-like metal-dependent hydrolase (beta-lactamase superfamily II)